MIGVFVNHDVIAAPIPAVHETDVVRRHAAEEATEPETSGPAAGQVPDVRGAEAASEVSVFPRMVEVIVRIVGTGVVSDPFAFIHVRRVGVAGFIGEIAVLFRSMRGSVKGARASRRGMFGGGRVGAAGFLGHDREREKYEGRGG